MSSFTSLLIGWEGSFAQIADRSTGTVDYHRRIDILTPRHQSVQDGVVRRRGKKRRDADELVVSWAGPDRRDPHTYLKKKKKNCGQA